MTTGAAGAFSCNCSLIFARFLDANRFPLRSKMLQIALVGIGRSEICWPNRLAINSTTLQRTHSDCCLSGSVVL
jgi:hypothetical protein